MQDINREIADLMDKRRWHLQDAQKIDGDGLFAQIRERHLRLAAECGEKIRKLCAEKKNANKLI